MSGKLIRLSRIFRADGRVPITDLIRPRLTTAKIPVWLMGIELGGCSSRHPRNC